ncbi:S-protein homolog 2 [Linum perenne]
MVPKNGIVQVVLETCLVLVGVAEAVSLFPETTVVITNELERGRMLKIHCKSKDDDLVFLGRSWFYCSMDWGEDGLHWFDIYISKRDEARCTLCQWYVKSNGLCYHTQNYEQCYLWNKSAP